MDTNSGEDSIQVFIRIKPTQQQQHVLAYTENQIKLDKHQFAFDKIFPPSASQHDIFHHVGNKLLSNVLDGYNSCIFVYGQTGSGKTHTMIGENNGLMQQSFNQLFSRINRLKNAQCFVTCSYFELYNEQIMDLLDPKKQKKLNIRQDAKKGVFVENLSQQTALDCQKLMEVLYTGMKNRHIGQTQMNRQSSRSHSVFTISLSCKIQQNGKKILKTPKLHFVDLAGSERQKMTQASGDRLKQAGNINKSLTTLGMVINALTSQKPRNHIPYRDSKLTCLLRDSLGGNSKTIIIATVSSLALSFQQTLSTLNFANRAKMVKVKALINEESLSTNLQVFKQQIRRLKAEIARLKSEHHRTPIKVVTHEIMSPKQIGSQFQHHFQQINKKINAISQQISQGVTSPSLQALLSNLQSKQKPIGSVQTMMDESHSMMEQQQYQQNQEMTDKCGPSQFIQYLTSNYQLLTQINTKVNQYLEVKQQLKHAAMNKKLMIQNLRTPSKFQRDQYEELLSKREDEIRFLQQKVSQLQTNLNKTTLQKKDYQRKLQMTRTQYSQQTNEQLSKMKQNVLNLQNLLQKQRSQTAKYKNQLIRNEKLNEELQIRLKQTKQLYLYSQEKYQNQKFNATKLSSKVQDLQKQLSRLKKINLINKQQKIDLQNEIQKLKYSIQDKQIIQEQLKKQLSQMQQTLDFNKKIIQQIKQKNDKYTMQLKTITSSHEQLKKQAQRFKQEKINYQQTIKMMQQNYTKIIEQKSIQIKQSQINNQKLAHQLTQKNNQIYEQKQSHLAILSKNQQQTNQLKSLVIQKQQHIIKLKNDFYLEQQKLNKIKLQNQNILANYKIKFQAKSIECNMIEENYLKYKQETQGLLNQFRKQLESCNDKIKELQSNKQLIESQNSEMATKIKTYQTKLASIQTIFDQNQQLKKSYKQLIKQNYKLKGKYQSFNQNQQLQKQKNQQLLSKVQFYEQKFKLMSIEYQQIKQSVKRLKQKELEANKKIQFYQENIKLKSIGNSDGEDWEEKNKLICELKDQNRELKYKLDNLEGNMDSGEQQNSGTQNSLTTGKRTKQQRQTASLNIKSQKLKNKLIHLMKNWQGFSSLPTKQHSTQQLIDICQVMLNQNAIKFDTIAKGIRRQQKLKSQNHFILKQNIYLKQRVEQLQKGTITNGDKLQDRPRKIVKEV